MSHVRQILPCVPDETFFFIYFFNMQPFQRVTSSIQSLYFSHQTIASIHHMTTSMTFNRHVFALVAMKNCSSVMPTVGTYGFQWEWMERKCCELYIVKLLLFLLDLWHKVTSASLTIQYSTNNLLLVEQLWRVEGGHAAKPHKW